MHGGTIRKTEGGAVRAMKRCYTHVLYQRSEKVMTADLSEMLGPVYHDTRITFWALSATKNPQIS